MNNNNPAKTFGVGIPSAFANSGALPQSIPLNNQPPHLPSQSQPQTLGVPAYPGHFQLSEPQSKVLGHSQYVQAAQAQFQSLVQQNNQSAVQHQHPSVSNAAGVSSPTVSLSGSGSAKRANPKPPSRPSGGSSNTNTASPFKTMELAPAAHRKKQKLFEKQIPDSVAAILPESSLYTQMLEFEARIDSALARKKIDIQDSLKNPSRIRKTLRMYIFNTFENQVQGEKNNAGPPSWSLKIIGRILEDGKDPVLAGMPQKSYSKFSSYFKRITIYLDQSLYPDNHVILWESARSPALNEGLEVKRKGDKEFNAIIRLEMNYTPEKFKLSPYLSEILGIEAETRSKVLVAFWHYIKSKKLQIPNDPSFFMCDPPLKKLFGEERVKFAMVSQKISQHLIPPQSIHLEHRIKLSGTCPAGTTCYDIVVDVPSPLQKDLAAFLATTEKHKEIDACDKLISDSIKKICEHRRRRAFFRSFSQSPAEFINTLIASQSKDLKLVSGDASRNAEKERQSGSYNQPWVEDAVIRYLNRKSAGNDTPGST
ncbi:SWI/SNF complex component SNF12 homolog [Mercurialis annua]|uniref:SWI/SNF complex component SNF12 homolog n=1 Tax=Mercurialis annua TaxID=3986 RepID=UPI00215E148F|nr:SWI/SNF complex component SNF12 homolog [Mercurialis annua]